MSHLGRLCAVVTVSSLGFAGLTVAASPAEATSYDPVGVQTASSWIANQVGPQGVLESGYEDSFTDPANPTWVLYDDQGLTIDAVESLVEADRNPAAVTSMTDAVEAEADVYAGYGPGQKAKLLVLADITGRDLDTFGGGGLVGGVEAQISASPGSVGRLENAYGSVLSQAYAARALTAAGSSKAPDAVSYLLRQQCPEGFFRGDYTSGDDCGATSTPNTDATALAVLELSGHVSGPAVDLALEKARTWLKTEQLADGSWDAAEPGVGNANATGLAARAIGPSAESDLAATWLWRHQAKAGDSAVLAPDAGAVAVDDTTYEDGQANGLDERSRTFWVRATAQALAVLRWLPSAVTQSLALTSPAGYQRAGASVTLAVTGTSAGDHLTLSGPGTTQSAVASSGQWSTTVALPAGTSARTYTVTDDRGHSASQTVNVLDSTTLRVARSKGHTVRRHKVTIGVRGLAPFERSVVRYKGHAVGRGHADAAGQFTVRFRVGRSLGVKRVVVFGAFRDIRHGRTTIRVTR